VVADGAVIVVRVEMAEVAVVVTEAPVAKAAATADRAATSHYQSTNQNPGVATPGFFFARSGSTYTAGTK
jgi:hypothetical protein